jgi:GNAT superfamily N-acetyltransferase
MVDEASLSGVDMAARPTVWRAWYEPASGRLQRVVITGAAVRLWYVEVPEPDADPPTVSLVAYASDHFESGTVIDNDTFEPLEVRSDEQVGAVRYLPATGRLHEVYVDPRRRRQGIATVLIYAASAHLLASGSSRRIWAGGYRTDLGEALARGLPHPQRVEARGDVAPPMTPLDDAEGVPSRNLYPEP